MNFGEMAISGVAIIPLVLGLVEFAKKFGLQGEACTALSVALGILFTGIGYAIESGLMPAAAVPWVQLVIVAVGGGLAASGLYDVSKRLARLE